MKTITMFSLGFAILFGVCSPSAADEGIDMPVRGICAHRGANVSHPENTLVAFKEAIRLGVHQIEFDVHLSKDKECVVIHDSTVDRTTDGSGRVSDLTLEEIKRLDAGRWKAAQFAGQRVPTLRETLEMMPQNIWLTVHLKGGAELGEAVAGEVNRQGRRHQAFLAAESPAANAARKVDPKILICNMDRPDRSARYVDASIRQNCQFVQLQGGPAPQDAMLRLKKNGVRVNLCCTNDVAALKSLYAAGVEFPLVDKVAPMMEQAKKLGIKPLKPTYATTVSAGDANRLTYLDEPCDPFYVHRTFPRLETAQWVGEEGVDAVVVLSIDDMRDPAHYERFLRPILDRLKKIDGRAPVSIMTNSVNPKDEQLQRWLKEGLSLEVHTIDHPCPCLGGGNFAAARSTYERCVDLMASIPGSQPVAYRMPCCDSINSTSPRFWSEIFNQKTTKGNFLRIDSSVFHLFTPADKTLPRDLVVRPDGKPRFRHYLPFPSFVNTIEDYPYPYVIGGLCWQFPCAVPSDWEGQHVQSPNNPATVADMKRAIDATVLKKGVTSLVFHPHGWIRSEQLVSLIDDTVKKHGRRVKFLNFSECAKRIEKHLVAGQRLRAADGGDNGVRLLDLNNDGFLDVVIGNRDSRKTRLWLPKERRWQESDFPVQIVNVDEDGKRHTAGVQFFITQPNGHASLLVRNERVAGVWHFTDGRWVQDKAMLTGLEIKGKPVFTAKGNRDLGVRLRDLDGDGQCELIAGGGGQVGVFQWNEKTRSWILLPFRLPTATSIVRKSGKDAGLRFVDVDGDGHDDVVFSDERRYSVHLYSSLKRGWDRVAMSGARSDKKAIPMIVRGDTNNGAWFAQRHMWVQNEHTQRMPNLVDRRSFTDLQGNMPPGPQSPAASQRAIEVRPGLRVELVAAEPLVMDPVAFDWGPDGRLWVVEMADYPLGLDDKGKHGGRVKFLRDTDGDGRYDKSTLFAEGLPYPTDVMAWRKGVLVTAAPNIWYLEDTTGDGKADRKEAWFTGFGEGNQQHRVNGLRWGLDNWVYLANGDSGGVIRSSKTGKVVNIGGRDLRIRPRTGLMQAVTGQTQHGRGRDDWGNWWGANNNTPMFQFVLDDHYLRRNPHVAPPDPRVHVATLGDSPLYPISRVLSHFSGYQPPPPGQPSRFTSACSTIVYRDTLLGDKLYGNMFVSEPVHNLVHRRVIDWQGVRMTSRKPADEQQREFLRSRDSWFRPTTIRTGPDGGIWIADMYRLVLEHPKWIADDVEKTLELRAGHDKGRIYCVVPEGKERRVIPNFGGKDIAQLVDALASPNGTVRDMAHRVLLWRDDRAAATPLLEKMVRTSKSALGRLHALCVLDGLSAVAPAHVIGAMKDEHPGVRRHAVRIAERFAADEVNREVARALVALANEEREPQVVMQLAYTLGEFDNAAAGRALGALSARHLDDTYIAAAALSGIGRRTSDVAAGAREARQKNPKASPPIEPLIRTALGNKELKSVGSLVDELIAEKDGKFEAWQFEALAGIEQALKRQGKSLDDIVTDEASRKRLWTAARRTLLDVDRPHALRSAALRLLGSDPEFRKHDSEVLVSLLSPQTHNDLQQAAIEAIDAQSDDFVAKSVLTHWRKFGPLTRDRLVEVMLRRIAFTKALLDAVKAKTIDPIDINATHRQDLLNHRDRRIATLAVELLQMKKNVDQQKLIDKYLPVVKAGGDPARGLGHFSKTCAQCHKIGGEGHDVGPNLVGLKDKTPEFLTTHILDPDRAIEDKYRNYTVITVDGKQFTGLLKSETATSVTLAGQNGASHTILKKDIEPELFQRSAKSMMPGGFEQFLSPQALADVVAFVIQKQESPKSFPGNKPRLVNAENGSNALRLRAAHAEIYGDSLVFEDKNKNLGFWASPNDRARWMMNVPKAGSYSVYLDWAVDPSSANHPFELHIASEKVTGRVESTGSWGNYRQAKIGTVQLKQGYQRVLFQSAGKPSNFLVDLREVCLVPIRQPPPDLFRTDDGASKPKRVEGNKPSVVRPNDDGTIELLAATAELYGKKLAIYQPQRCIGWWTDRRDHVIWRIEAAKAGQYDVQLEWSVPDDMAGNKFEVVNVTNKSRMDAAIPTTGGFKHYKVQSLGRIKLNAGDNVIRMQPTARVKGELADLRRLSLRPLTK